MNPFRSKIKCIHCGKNFKRKKERGKIKFVCQTYDNGNGCRRIVLEEDFIRGVLEKRFQRKLSDNDIADNLISMEVEDKLLFTIHLLNQEPIVYGKNHIVY